MKVLIITYYWPPAGGPGVQRWLKFVKYFKDFGIEPVVYTAKNPTYPIEDESLISEVPNNVTILKHSIFEPYRFAEVFSKKEAKTISKGIITNTKKQSLIQKLLLYIRGNFFIPDARKFWIKPSVKYLRSYLLNHQIDLIITTGPPHSIHLIGNELKNQLDIRWIADFRDPWTTIGYHNKLKLTKRSLKRHKALEKKVLANADHIVVTSFTTQVEFKEITNTPVSVITNGYDLESLDTVTLDTKFTISHIGSLLSGRDPKLLWKALYDLSREDKLFAESLQLQLIGTVSEDVVQSIKEAGLNDFLMLKGYVPHGEAIKIQRSSQVLLLIEIDSPVTKCIIPGKLFEYMASERPIIAIGPKDADISRLIKETNSGVFFEHVEYESVKVFLRECFDEFLKGSLKPKTKEISTYSRKSLTKKFAELIKNS